MNSELLVEKEETAYDWYYRCIHDGEKGNEREEKELQQQQQRLKNNLPHHPLFSRILTPEKKKMTVLEGCTTSFFVCSLVVQILLRFPQSIVTILDPEYRIPVEIFQDIFLSHDSSVILQNLLRRIHIYHPEVDYSTSQVCYLESYSHSVIRLKKPQKQPQDCWLIYHNYPHNQRDVMRKLCELESYLHSKIICTIHNDSSTNIITRNNNDNNKNKNNLISLRQVQPGTQEHRNGFHYVALIPMEYVAVDDNSTREVNGGTHTIIPYKITPSGIQC